jgi:hypothetical protein
MSKRCGQSITQTLHLFDDRLMGWDAATAQSNCRKGSFQIFGRAEASKRRRPALNKLGGTSIPGVRNNMMMPKIPFVRTAAMRLRKRDLHSDRAPQVRPIESIFVGQYVWAWDRSTAQPVKRRVRRLFRRHGQRVLTIHYRGADGREHSVTSTLEHPFQVKDRGWVPASRLQPEDRLQCIDGGEALVARVRHHAQATEVFNFEVDRLHNYFVGSTGVLVHNASRDPDGDSDTTRSEPTRARIPVAWDLPDGHDPDIDNWSRDRLATAPVPVGDEIENRLASLGFSKLHLVPAHPRDTVMLGNKVLPGLMTRLDNPKGMYMNGGFKIGWPLDDELFVVGNKPELSPFGVLGEFHTLRALIDDGWPFLGPLSMHWMYTGGPASIANGRVQLAYTLPNAGLDVRPVKPRTIARVLMNVLNWQSPAIDLGSQRIELSEEYATSKVIEATVQHPDAARKFLIQLKQNDRAVADAFREVNRRAKPTWEALLHADEKPSVPVDTQGIGDGVPLIDPLYRLTPGSRLGGFIELLPVEYQTWVRFNRIFGMALSVIGSAQERQGVGR